MRNYSHIPVLLKEVVVALDVSSGGKYIDATIGGGGHGFEILKRGGILLGIDQDREAIEFVKRSWKQEARGLNIEEWKLTLVRGNFRDIGEIARANGFLNVAGILFDLGFSSYQIEASGRGFSFSRGEPLDMRMDQAHDLTAEKIVNSWSKDELSELFMKYGEEENAQRIADAITNARHNRPIGTSRELGDLIVRTVGFGKRGVHPATRIFQALRIAVNDEIGALRRGLDASFDLVGRGGRIVVISFHSLEDRITKNMFREKEMKGLGRVITKKPIEAAEEEVKNNPRARSAKLRIFEMNNV